MKCGLVFCIKITKNSTIQIKQQDNNCFSYLSTVLLSILALLFRLVGKNKALSVSNGRRRNGASAVREPLHMRATAKKLKRLNANFKLGVPGAS